MNRYTPYHQAAAAGAVIVTVNRRLARTLQREYAFYQKTLGHHVWPRPQIFTLESWLRNCVATLGETGRLLSSPQVDCLWQQVIRADLQQNGVNFIQLQATAKTASQARRLLSDAGVTEEWNHPEREKGTPQPAQSDLSADHRAFRRWLTRYLHQCQKHGWIDPAAMTPFVCDAFACEKLKPPCRLIVLGFDNINAVQKKLFRVLERKGGCVEIIQPEVSEPEDLSCCPCVDERSEIVAAARWARSCLEQQLGRVAVIVPELERLHPMVERIFLRELAGSHHSDGLSGAAFNISLGQPLAQHGMIATALLLLSIGDDVDFETISYVLRSPWLSGGVSEAGARANFEAFLRRRNITTITLRELTRLCRQHGRGCRLLSPLLEHLCVAVTDHRERTLAQWAERFDLDLRQLGWPGERVLDSPAFQVLTAWQEKLLPQFAALDVVHPAVGRGVASSFLRTMANEQLFQAQAQDERLQVVGLLESAGLHADALWVMGLTDRVLPGVVQYNPFIPVALQREHKMPHSSVEREDEYATVTLQRLLAAAKRVVLSYPCGDHDRALLPSPFIQPLLLSGLHVEPLFDAGRRPDYADSPLSESSADSVCEYLQDDVGAPLLMADPSSDSEGNGVVVDVSGGTSVLKEQALCPFRAYIHCRLKVRALEVVHLGLDGRVRGTLLHKILEQFWGQIGSHERLCSLTESALEEMVRHLCHQIIDKQLHGQAVELLPIEVTRLTRLIVKWLQNQEKPRRPFKVLALEQRCEVELGSLRFHVVPDRIDCLEEGGKVIIDYKSGLVHSSDLLGARLLEPQLPIYALHNMNSGSTVSAAVDSREVVAVAFAQIRAGDCALKGVAVDEGLLDGVKSVSKSVAAKRGVLDWQTLLDEWQLQLEHAARAYSMAEAQVNPVNGQACQFCDLQRLCRIAARKI